MPKEASLKALIRKLRSAPPKPKDMSFAESFAESHVMNACEAEYSLMSKTNQQIKTEMDTKENENTALADMSYGQDKLSDCDHCLPKAHGTLQDAVDLDQSLHEEEVTVQPDELPTQNQDAGESIHLRSAIFEQGALQGNDENSLIFGKAKGWKEGCRDNFDEVLFTST